MKTILKKHILFLISGSFFLPTFVFAQQKLGAEDFMAGINDLDRLLQTLTTGAVKSAGVLLMAVAMVVFLLGIVQYLWGLREGKEATVTAGKQFMAYGLVALFVMFSVYGIIKLAQSVLFNSKDINTITIPELNFKAQSSAGANNNNAQPLIPVGSSANSAYDACVKAGNGSSECRTILNNLRPTGTKNTSAPAPAQPATGGAPTTYLCSDGVTTYTDPSDAKFCPKVTSYLCPDGVTSYTDPSDAKLCPKPTTYLCPDGVTSYTDPSDAKFCPK
jgi:uncharacterized membrane protein YidH (DUF202 family)